LQIFDFIKNLPQEKMFNKKIITISFLTMLILEVLAFTGWTFPMFGQIVFWLLLAGVGFLAWKRLELALLVVFGELFLTSKGYLFSATIGDFRLSLRIGLFLVILAVFFWKYFQEFRREKDWQNFKLKKNFLYFGVVLAWAILWGLFQNSLGNVFRDANAWLFFAYLLPVIFVGKRDSDFVKNVLSVLVASIFFIFIKTFLVFYIFTHWLAVSDIFYGFVRDTLVGEITFAGGGFWRIFFQSHVFSLLALFIFLPFLISENNQSNFWQNLSFKLKNIKNLQAQKNIYFFFVVIIATLFISFSRSFWLAGVVGLFIYLFYFIFIKKKLVNSFGLILNLIILSGLGLLLVSFSFYLPPKISDIDLQKNFLDRTTKMEGAASSRVSQALPIMREIIRHPLIGSGFGKEVTYISSDPRVLEVSPDGRYTTYAFEWGYLDMILKYGLVGFFVWAWLIWQISVSLWQRRGDKLSLGFLLALVVLSIVNIFSPYFNHPLGIGFILLVVAHNKN
jgi:hypothetical protein